MDVEPKKRPRVFTTQNILAVFFFLIAVVLWITGPAVDRFLGSDFNTDIPSIETLKLAWNLGHSAVATLLSAASAYLLSREQFRAEVIEKEFQRQRESAAASARRLYKLQVQIEEMNDSWEELRVHHALPAPTTSGIVRHLRAMRQEILSQMDDLGRIIQDRRNPLLLADFETIAGCPFDDCEGGEVDFARLSPFPGDSRHARCQLCKRSVRGTRNDTGSIRAVPAERRAKRDETRPCPAPGCGETLIVEFRWDGPRRTACIHCQTSFEIDVASKSIKSVGKKPLLLDSKHVVVQRGRARAVCAVDNTILSPSSFRRNAFGVSSAACFSCGSVIIDESRLIEIDDE